MSLTLLGYTAKPIGDGLWQVETVRRAPDGGKVEWCGTMETSDLTELEIEISLIEGKAP